MIGPQLAVAALRSAASLSIETRLPSSANACETGLTAYWGDPVSILVAPDRPNSGRWRGAGTASSPVSWSVWRANVTPRHPRVLTMKGGPIGPPFFYQLLLARGGSIRTTSFAMPSASLFNCSAISRRAFAALGPDASARRRAISARMRIDVTVSRDTQIGVTQVSRFARVGAPQNPGRGCLYAPRGIQPRAFIGPANRPTIRFCSHSSNQTEPQSVQWIPPANSG